MATVLAQLVGYEWDAKYANGAAPADLVTLAESSVLASVYSGGPTDGIAQGLNYTSHAV